MIRPRRSVLFSPGDRPDMMRKAPATGADVVVFDLEDAVAPDKKGEAREAVNEVLQDFGPDPDTAPNPEVLVRVTPDAWGKDLDRAVAGEPRLDGIMLPKVGSAADIEALAAGLDERSADVPVAALIESASGVLNAAEIADADPVDALCFGAEDLAADVGAERTPEGIEVLYAREKCVLAAASAGIDAIDTVFTEIGERDRLREETEFARGLGYDGKMAIHPAQVGVINEAFTPNADRVAWANRVLDARDEAERESKGVFRVDDEMVDAPLIAQAERIVALADAADGPDRPRNHE